MTVTADQLALRYRATRDPRALAELFDGTAPDLLRVARWLTGDRQAAEDVVQETFLTFVDRLEDHDAARPVVPWLMGIAANLARRWRRQNARRRALQGRGAPGGPIDRSDPTADPSALAEAEDLRRHLAATIDRLPPAVAQVLRLSVEHDLAPREIARALDRPDGTVRSQLSRGLAMLRDALPAGLIGAGAAAMAASTGLAAVRRHVLEHAAAKATSAAVATPFAARLLAGLIAMKTSSVVLSALVVVAIATTAAMIWAPQAARPDRRTGFGAPADGVPRQVVGSVADREGAVSEAPVRDRVDGASPAVEAPRVLRGRAIASETGAPLAGVGFVLLATAPDRLYARRVAEQSSGDDGRFVLRVPEQAEHQMLAVRGEVEGRVPVQGLVLQDDLGDVAMSAGPEVELTVVDEDGVPMPGVWLHMAAVQPVPAAAAPPCPLRADPPMPRMRSDEQGRVEVGRIAAGRWRVQVLEPCRLAAPLVLDLPSGPPVCSALVRLAGRVGDLVIEGVVVDEGGAPVVDVDLTVESGTFDLPSAATDADGRFRLLGAPRELGSREPVRLAVYPPDAFHRPEAVETVWGSRDVRVVLQSAAGSVLEVAVEDAVTGALLPDFEVRCAHAFGGAVLVADSEVDDRRALLRGVRAGTNFVTAFPAGADYLPSETTRFDHSLGSRAILVLPVHRAAPLHVRVRTEAGEPVVSTRVELLRTPAWVTRWGDAAASVSWLNVWRRAEPADNQDGYSHGPTLIDARSTDARGEVRLRAATGLDYGIRVLGPGHAPFLLESVVASPSTVEVTVRPGAGLRGRVRGAEAVLDYGRLALVSVDRPGYSLPNDQIESLAETDDLIAGAAATMRVAADGSFDFHDLPSGRWRIVLEAFELAEGRPNWNRLAFPTVVELRDGETTEVVLDGSWMRPGVLEGSLLFGGATRVSGRIVLEAAEEGSVTGMGVGRHAAAGQLQSGGRFGFERLPAGRYRLWLQLGEATQSTSLCLGDWIDVRPGQLEVRQLEVPTTNIELELLCRDRPLARTAIWLVGRGGLAKLVHARTDGGGVLRLQHVPPGVYEVRTDPNGGADAVVTVPAAGPAAWTQARVLLATGGR